MVLSRLLAFLLVIVFAGPSAAQTSGPDESAMPAPHVVAGAGISTARSANTTTVSVGGGVTKDASSHTVTAAEWGYCQLFDFTTAQTLTLPVATSLSTSGCIVIKTEQSGVVTLAPNAADGVNGGTINTSVTIPVNTVVVVSTTGASGVNAIQVPIPNPGGVGVKIATCALASTTCNFNSLGSHDYYHLKCTGVTVSTTADMIITFNSDVTSGHYKTSDVYSGSVVSTPQVNGSFVNSGTSIQMFGGLATADTVQVDVFMGNFASTTLQKQVSFVGTQHQNAGPYVYMINGSGEFTQTGTAVTSVQVTTSAGTFGSGANKCSMYAYDS